MKSLRPVIAGIAFMLCASAGFSQSSKQPLFVDYPSSIACKATVFEKALAAKEGQQISLEISDAFKFSGIVVSNVVKYGKMQTVVIRSTEFDGALLLVSKQQLENSKYTLTGRILSPRASDGYQIKQASEGSYVFEKIDAARLLETCSHP
jgi:hypothetical protein